MKAVSYAKAVLIIVLSVQKDECNIKASVFNNALVRNMF